MLVSDLIIAGNSTRYESNGVKSKNTFAELLPCIGAKLGIPACRLLTSASVGKGKR